METGGFGGGGGGRVEGLEGVVVAVVVGVWLRDFLLLEGRVVGEEAVVCSLPLRVRSKYSEGPCCGFRQSQAFVGLEEF